MKKEYKNYKVKFTKEEKQLFNTIESEKVRKSVMSLYANLVIRANKQIEEGKSPALTFSYRTFLKTYNRSHTHISLGNFKNRLDILIDLKLLSVKKNIKNCTYYLNRFTNDKKHDENGNMTNEKQKQEKHNKENINNILNTNNIIDQLSNAYKGVEYNKIASKEQLRKIAKALLVAYEINSKNIHDKCIQWLVFKKIRFSNKKINLVGAVNYIKTIILEKLNEVKQKNFKVPTWLDNNNTTSVNFTQREYTQEQINDLEKMLLESSFVF